MELDDGFTWTQFRQLKSGEANIIKTRRMKGIGSMNLVGLFYHGKTHYRAIRAQTFDGESVTLELGGGSDEKPEGMIMWFAEPYPGTGYTSDFEAAFSELRRLADEHYENTPALADPGMIAYISEYHDKVLKILDEA